MNLDELISVWRTQDTTPLHEVNRTLLHLALRQDEARLQKKRRIERWLIYLACAGIVVSMTIFIAMMIGARNRNIITLWDYVIAIVGAVAALISAASMYASYRRQSQREGVFGGSLRDQLKRRISQHNDDTAEGRTILILLLMAGICPIAILILSWRVNGKSFSDDGYLIVWLILISIYSVVTGFWELRRQSQETQPNIHELEKLLIEIESPKRDDAT